MTDNNTADTAVDGRWHKQPAMWVVMGILGFTVVSAVGLLFIATSNPPDLIDKNAPVRIEAPDRR